MAVTLTELNAATCEDFTGALGHVFEHSPWVAAETWWCRPFADVRELHEALCSTLRRAAPERQLALIRAHPDLAGRLAQQGCLTAESTREQAGAGLDRLAAGELAQFQLLNAEYKTRFGFPFVICARLNARDAILSAMHSRLLHTPEVEYDTSLAEIEKIAWLRLQDMLAP